MTNQLHQIPESVLHEYGFEPENICVEIFGSGLINRTWKIADADKSFILQKINTNVFKKPVLIATNIKEIAQYLRIHHPEYFFVVPVQTRSGKELATDTHGNYYRLTSFVKDSHTIDVVQTVDEAFHAAQQFGRFTHLLSGFNVAELAATIPNFHNLGLRYDQFEESLQNGNKLRIEKCAAVTEKIIGHKDIVAIFENIKTSAAFKLRVTHHDTKISNVLFDRNDKAICVIDLDTVMPGYFISDVGDMLRTYLSPVSEEEKNFERIDVREEFFEAIVKGYLSEMKSELSVEETGHFVYAGKFMLYMQAVRFLTDHFNNDIYYGATYEDHNLVRANNQIVLLEKFEAKEKQLQKIVSDFMMNNNPVIE